MSDLDAVVVGAGPNGLAAAIALAQRGLAVRLIEARETVGGGVKSEALTLPGYLHDTCSAIHSLAAASPFLSTLPLERHGLEWIHPEHPLAHVLDDRVALLCRSMDETQRRLGGAEGRAWRGLLGSTVDRWNELAEDILAPPRMPRHPLLLARFGLSAIRPASGLARARLPGEASRALFAGLAAHSFLELERAGSSAFGLVLGALAHVAGWPMPRGGAGRLADALAAHFVSLGGTIETGRRVESLEELPPARAVVLDLTPRQVVAIAGDRLPPRYRARLEAWRYGPAAFKVDWALSEPIPWRHSEARLAGTVHLGGTLEEVSASERAHWRGGLSDRPFVLLVQPTLVDPSRAPPGRHVAWGYCHVPLAWTGDALDAIESQVERFAPGFRDCVLARNVLRPKDLEARNANVVGGDINGGTADLAQVFFRPVASLHPHATPVPHLYLCSSSTPPGGGVHGMGGWHAAQLALKRSLG